MKLVIVGGVAGGASAAAPGRKAGRFTRPVGHSTRAPHFPIATG
jgi:hypothetical protein